MKLVDTSLTTDNGRVIVLAAAPLTRTSQRTGSHEGGDTSYVTQ
jgi:hypothetical protein